MKSFVISLKALIIFTILAGIMYPLIVTGIAEVFFHNEATGSFIKKDGNVIGSKLIGQSFDSIIYFCSRPSYTDYNLLPAGASNQTLTNKKLKEQFEQRKLQFLTYNKLCNGIVLPGEMLFASGSGIDPHISPEAALLQADRVADARKLNCVQKRKLLKCIEDLTEPPQYLLFGSPRINVLLLNLETDKIK